MQKRITVKMEPGSRTTALINKGEEYGQVICSRTVNKKQDKVTMIGEECDLLGMASPYTYIVSHKTLCYVTSVDSFYNMMIDLNPLGLEDLKADASRKLR